MEPNNVISISHILKTVENDKAVIKAEFKINGQTYLFSLTSTKKDSELNQSELEVKIRHIINAARGTLDQLQHRCVSLTLGEREFNKTYVRKDGRLTSKTYNPTQLNRLITDAERNQKTQKALALKAIQTFLQVAATTSIAQVTLSKKEEQRFYNQSDAMKADMAQMRPLRNMIRAKKEALRNKDQDPWTPHVDLAELKQLYRQFDEKESRLKEGFFGKNLMIKTFNRTANYYKEDLDEKVKQEYTKIIHQLKAKYGHDLTFAYHLDTISFPKTSDVYYGYCSQFVMQFMMNLEEAMKIHGTLDEKMIVSAVNEFVSEGLENPTFVAFKLFQQVVENSNDNMLQFLLPKEKRQGIWKELAHSFVEPPPRTLDEKTERYRKSQNTISKALLQKKLSKPVTVHMSDRIVIPKDLPRGVYQVSIRNGQISEELEPFFHSISYVKLNKNHSYIFDPNIGLIYSGDAELTDQVLKNMQNFYVAYKFALVSSIQSSIYRLGTEKPKKSTSKS